MLRVRQQTMQQPAEMLTIDEDEMRLTSAANPGSSICATRTPSNEAWFDRLAVDKTIAKALKHSYNLCFMVYGQKGSGKDYCVTGGIVQRAPSTATSLQDSQVYEPAMDALAHKHREPGLIRLAYEAVVAQICVNKNA